MKAPLFISASFIIGIICVGYIRSFDEHEKEPFWKMFAVTCWGGAWSVALALLMFEGLARMGIRDIQNSLGALLVIGPVEELAKLTAMISAYPFLKREINEPVDGILYMSCVALGFSLIENCLYAMLPNHGHLLFFRLFISTPMHICFSSFMGLAFYVWLQNRHSFVFFLGSYGLASFSHGLYDLLAFNGFIFILLIVVVRMGYLWTLSLLGYAAAQSPYRKTLETAVRTYPAPTMEKGIECLHCGSRNSKLTFRLGRIRIQKCDSCIHYVASKRSLELIFRHFAATFRDFAGRTRSEMFREGRRATIGDGNRVLRKKKIACFNLDALNRTLEAVNRTMVTEMEAKWWFPRQLLDPAKQNTVPDYREMAREGHRSFTKWLVYPFSSDQRERLFISMEKPPSWNWGAFLIPELWFLYHEIWGPFLLIHGLYLGGIWVMIRMSPEAYVWMFMAGLMLLVRIVFGRIGNTLYYHRHGRWPGRPETGEDLSTRATVGGEGTEPSAGEPEDSSGRPVDIC